MKNLIILASMLVFVLSCNNSPVENTLSMSPGISSLKTFGTMGKELEVLRRDTETELFAHTGKGTLTHMWFGGTELDHIVIRVYIDNEE